MMHSKQHDQLGIRKAFSSKSKCVPNTLHIEKTVNHRPPKFVIASGGAQNLPPHTLPAFRLALETGADFVQSGLVPTEDGRLISLPSVNLEETTNVKSVYGKYRDPWHSPYMDQAGYWSFNFTYKELQKLKVKQPRSPIPTAASGLSKEEIAHYRKSPMRSSLFDEMFDIPLLEEVLELVIQWNHDALPGLIVHTDEIHNETSYKVDEKRHPSPLELYESGLILQLSDVSWLMQEANLDLVKLLIEHMQAPQHTFAWNWMLPCYEEIVSSKYYKVPGLVLQSTNANAIQQFHFQWTALKDESEIPEPPYVLMVGKDNCHEETFWNDFTARNYNDLFSGIAPDKECLLPSEEDDRHVRHARAGVKFKGGSKEASKEESNQNSTTSSIAKSSLTLKNAREYNLVIHPRTGTLDKTLLTRDSRWPEFNKGGDEMTYILCNIDAPDPSLQDSQNHVNLVNGIITEDVSAAVIVAELGCKRPAYRDPALPTEENDRIHMMPATAQSADPPFCLNNDREMGMYLSMLLAILGFVVGRLLCTVQRDKKREKTQRKGHIVLPASASAIGSRRGGENLQSMSSTDGKKTKKKHPKATQQLPTVHEGDGRAAAKAPETKAEKKSTKGKK